mmetsp:Transcript_29069/g.84074  ORF Transcript_29069/g.84074 Transcript_29069/m.84074 type:complete len:110 (+) Transcript_29069:407-736(+)
MCTPIGPSSDPQREREREQQMYARTMHNFNPSIHPSSHTQTARGQKARRASPPHLPNTHSQRDAGMSQKHIRQNVAIHPSIHLMRKVANSRTYQHQQIRHCPHAHTTHS